MLPYIKQVLAEFKSPLLTKINEDMDPLTDITSLIRNSITDDPPLAQKDGGIIREGYNEDVDKSCRSGQRKKWLSELEAKREGTYRYQKPEDQVQSCIWLFSGSYQYFQRSCAGGLYPQTDPYQCRALYHSGTERSGRSDPWS